ncbi:MAG TPA: 3-hydroxyacyl-ACP dehydratase FabZ [Gammaproteobacteria bacterium]|jgi:3-hydroxyacyl-[acyl-carrier-protein] dehydratase|nr:3-hydroxyacyl-ACP dehydratase FabZ [Gammaproteobacteria bacterium]
MAQQPFLDIHAIMRQLPHRYPFLLIDRVLECTPGETLTALKNVTINEPFFPGHFPQRPVMPGVLILEAMAQAAGLLAMSSHGHTSKENELYYFVGIDKARFRQQVEPGDQLIFKVKVLATKRGIWKFAGVAEVEDRVAAEAELMCAARQHD